MRLWILAVLFAACGGSDSGVSQSPGSKISCKGEERVVLDCSSEVNYQGTSGEAGVKVMDIASAEGKFEEKAIRRVNEQVEQFAAAHKRACRDYNACILSAEDYRAEATEARRRLQVIPALMEALKSAKTEGERVKILDQLYRGVVPDEKRVEEVTFQLGMVAELPDDLGGGSFAVEPGSAVPSGARVHFKVNVSREAYVYIFQSTKSGEVSVLFPDPRIGTRNPLGGGSTARIPSDKTFRLNDKDVGTENVYIVVSRKPVTELDKALQRVKSGQVSTLSQNQTLTQVATVQAGPSRDKCKTRALELDGDGGGGGGCTRSRGLALEDGGDEPADLGGGVPATMQTRTMPGDELIVTVFSFEHLTAEAYASAGGSGGKSKTRGIVIEQ